MAKIQTLTNSQIFKARDLLRTESLEAVARELDVRQSTVARYLPELADAARERNASRTAKVRASYVTKDQMVAILRKGTNMALTGLENASYDAVEQVFRSLARA